MNNRIIVFLGLLTFILSACEGSRGYDMSAKAESTSMSLEMEEMADESESFSSQNTGKESAIQRKVIKTGNIRFEVKDIEETTKRITDAVKAKEGYVSGTNLTNSHYETNNEVVIRVPSKEFDPMVESLLTLALYVDYKRVSSADVTEEFLDIQTRLETKKTVRDRYVDILKNKAKTVEDLLNAEDKIRVIQEEIESIEGRLKYLRDQVGMSTIQLTIYQKKAYEGARQRTFVDKIGDAFGDGWKGLGTFVLLLVNVWPFLILIILIILIIWGFRRYRQNKRNT